MPREFAALCLMLLLLPLLAGCGESLEAQVSGTVTLDGKPLDKGDIVFHPADSGTPAYGSIDPEGKYSVKTGQGEGMLPGEYIVVVKVTSEVTPVGGEVAVVEKLPELLSPKKYAMKQTSPLKYTVTSGEQTIDIPLDSKP
jgi:hypothetical protein